MYYITVKQSPSYHQMSLEDFLFNPNVTTGLISLNYTNTRTYEVERISDKFLNLCDTNNLIEVLHEFNVRTEKLRQRDRHSLYRTFYIPKKSGGLRKINAPEPELMNALRELKLIFENDFGALYHTSAFAYIKGRSTIECLKRHQSNESRWYAKFDLHDFFGSTTKKYVEKMFSVIFPFSEVLMRADGKKEFMKAIDLCFLDGGLPQGTPISPTITNIMMIPVDFKISKLLRDFNNNRYVYTRYADDFQISSKYSFRFKDVERELVNILKSFGAPFELNTTKTRYGSSAGANWNLGLMINKDNQITVGHVKKKHFENMLYAYINDKKAGRSWPKEDIMVMEGHRNYYKMVEGETIDRIIAFIDQKYGVDVVGMIKQDLRG